MTVKVAYNNRGLPLKGALQTKSGCQFVGNGIKASLTEQAGLYCM